MNKAFLKKIISAVFLFFFVFMNVASASNTEVIARFAKQSEIIGYWKLVPFPEGVARALNKINPWPLPYQWFGILEDGKMYTMMSSEDADLTEHELKKIFSSLPGSLDYQFHKGFMIVTNKELPKYREIWGINVVTKKTKIKGLIEVLPGDLLMSLDSGNGKGPVYYRHLRRI